MKSRLGTGRSIVALVAALLFIAQASVAAAAGVAARPMLDVFGNPLCITGMTEDADAPADHGKLPNCCTLGCSTAGAGALVPVLPDAVAIDYPAWVALKPAVLDGPVVRRSDHDPWRPRGPPSTT